MKKLLALLAALLITLPVFAQETPIVKPGEDTVTISKKEYEALKKYAPLLEVKKYIDDYFYEEPDEQAMLDGAINGYLQGLGDIYTFYYNEKSWTDKWADDEGKYAGIGIQLLGNQKDGSVTIIRVFKGTPAEAAGMRKGDILHKVEDIAINATTLEDAVKVMRGTPGETVHISVIRDFEPIDFELKKAEISINRVESRMLDNKIGLICAYEFAGDVAKEFEQAVKDLTAQGMRALIVDLRDNPGGWVDSAKSMADIFLDRELLFYSEDRHKVQEKTYTTNGKNDIPLVVLVNENSASASEIFTGAMQDLGRATIVGTATYGKGVIQVMTELAGGKTGIQFTIAQYFTPKGNKVHKVGITPDIEAALPKGKEHLLYQFGDLADTQLKAAYDETLKKAK